MSAQTPAGAPTTPDPPQVADTEGASDEHAIDYAEIVATPEFKELHESRRRFVRWGMVVATGAVIGVFALYGFAPDAMAEPAIGSLTWALVLGFGLVVLSFAMAVAFARASRKWDAMVAVMMKKYDTAAFRSGRFDR